MPDGRRFQNIKRLFDREFCERPEKRIFYVRTLKDD